MKQKWGKLKKDAKALYEVVPIKKFCHGKPKSTIFKLPEVSNEDRDRIFNIVLDACPDSEIAKMVNGSRTKPLPQLTSSGISQEYCREILSAPVHFSLQDETTLYAERAGNTLRQVTLRDLPQEYRQFLGTKVLVTLDQAVNVATDPAGQGSEYWLRARSVRITASRARELITYVNNRNPNWESKVAGYFSNEFQGTSATAHGIRAEPWARSCYEAKTGLTVLESGLLIHPNVPWLGCSLDGIVKNQRTVEFKCPVKGKEATASEVVRHLKFIDSSNLDQLCLKEDHSYYCQVQLGLFVTNLEQCDFVIYSTFDDSCVIIPVQYNENLVINDYLPKLQYIYFRYCLKHLITHHVNNDSQ